MTTRRSTRLAKNVAATNEDVNARLATDVSTLKRLHDVHNKLQNEEYFNRCVASVAKGGSTNTVLREILNYNKWRASGRKTDRGILVKNLKYIYETNQYKNATEKNVKQFSVAQLIGFARCRNSEFMLENFVEIKDAFAKELIRKYFGEEESEEDQGEDEEESVEEDDGGEDPPSGSPVNSPAVGKNGGSPEGGEGSPDGKRGGDPPARSPPTKSPATTGGSSIKSDDDKQKEGVVTSQLRATSPAKENGSTRSTHSRAEKGIGKKADVSASAAIAEAIGDSTTPEAKGGEVPATSNQVRDAQAAFNFTTPKHGVAPTTASQDVATAKKLDYLLNARAEDRVYRDKALEFLDRLSNNQTQTSNTLGDVTNLVGDLQQTQAQNKKDIAQIKKDTAQNTKDIAKQGQQLGKHGQQIADLEEVQADLKKSQEQTAKKAAKKAILQYLEEGTFSPDSTNEGAFSPDSTNGSPIQGRPLFSEGGNQKGGAAPPVAAASIESLYGVLNNVVSNDDDDDANRMGSMEGFAKDENGGEDQCDVASACEKLRGIESADVTTPEQVYKKLIPTIGVLQDSGITNGQRLVALCALKHALGVGRNNEGVASGRNNEGVASNHFVRKAFDEYGGASLYQCLADLQVPGNYPKEVRDLAKSIVVEYYYTDKEGDVFADSTITHTTEDEGATESKDGVVVEPPGDDGGEEEETGEHFVSLKDDGISGATARKFTGEKWEDCFDVQAILVPDVNKLTLTFRFRQEIILSLSVERVEDPKAPGKPFQIVARELSKDAQGVVQKEEEPSWYKVKVDEHRMWGLADALGKMKNKIAQSNSSIKVL